MPLCPACRREFAFSPILPTPLAIAGVGGALALGGVAAGDLPLGFHEPYSKVFLNMPFEGDATSGVWNKSRSDSPDRKESGQCFWKASIEKFKEQ